MKLLNNTDSWNKQIDTQQFQRERSLSRFRTQLLQTRLPCEE